MTYVNPFRPITPQRPNEPDPTSGDAADKAAGRTGPTDPVWLTDGTPLVVYFPRPRPELAEAWPVLSLRRTAQTVVVLTELGEERFGRFDLRMQRTRGAGAYQPMLLPAHDPRAVAAWERTNLLRAVKRLTDTIRVNRPSRTMDADAIRRSVAEIAMAAATALDDLDAVPAVRP